MNTSIRRVIFAAFAIFFSFSISGLWAQSAGSGGTIYGTVTDATGAIVPGATVTIQNPVSSYSRTATSDSAGHYQFTNLPLNPYHLSVSVKDFAPYHQDVDVRSSVPITLKNTLAVGEASTVIDVTASDLLENDSTFHTDIDRDCVQQTSVGEPVFFAQLAGDPVFAGRCCRFERSLSWTGRSRIELVFHRWPTDHGPAEQGLLESASFELGAVA